ncbi:hypothetical protein L195_g050183 [Trifolium pratense]|uniref:Uncharacterized protein n=1 Tax=Trifolium pratense TaxID=57577 RepID=A0A2K3JSL4_TRIPR|nr:hypothetical protein L195_g050183 [Trifolium pratense]
MSEKVLQWLIYKGGVIFEEEGLQNEKKKKMEDEWGWSGVEQSSDKLLFQGNRGLRRSNPSLLAP